MTNSIFEPTKDAFKSSGFFDEKKKEDKVEEEIKEEIKEEE